MDQVMNWQKRARNLLKAELTRKGMSYEDLSHALLKIGVTKSVNSINVAIHRGTFSFVFFLQCAKAINLNLLHLDD